MARSLLLPVALAFAVVFANAQTQMNYMITPAYATRALRPVDLGGGNTLYACERSFNYDSSYVELLWTDPFQAVTSSVSYRLQTPLTFLYDAEKLDDGFVFCGQTYDVFPFVLKTDATGAVQWYYWMDNLAFFQRQIVRILPRGSDFTVYSAQGGILSTGVYRLEGNASGTTWSGNAIMAPGNIRMSVYETMAMTDPMEQLVAGTAYSTTDQQNLLAMVMWTTASGATWMKTYDIEPSSDTQSEEIRSLVATSDGNYVCAGYVTTGPSTYEGFILKIDALGGVIWCKRYSDSSGGLLLSAVTELPGGELLAAGVDANYHCMVLNLDATGGLLQARRYLSPGGGSELTDDVFTNSIGELKLMTREKVINFSSGGASCDFVDVTTVAAASYTPTPVAHSMVNTPFTPTTQSMNTFERTPVLGWVQTCVISGVEEMTATVPALHAFPDPSDGMVQFEPAGTFPRAERVVVRAISGAVVFDGPYNDGIDLQHATAGVYVIEIPRTQQRTRVMRR